MEKTFSPEVVLSNKERANRFIEEALELVQAIGYDKEQVLKIVDYVYNRPKGELKQEVGGVMVTLAAFCNNFGISITNEAWKELSRITHPDVIEKIRAKQASKVNDNVAIKR